MKPSPYDPKRPLEIDDAKGYRDSMWSALFTAMREDAPEHLRELGALEVEEWLRHCRLDRTDGNWIRRYAREVRANWQISEFLWRKLSIGMVTGTGFMKGEPDPLQIAGWSPQTEPEAEFQARVQAAVEEHVNKVLAAHSWRQSKSYRDGMRDMHWLVKFQVLGWTWEQVADSDHSAEYSRGAVKEAVHRLAEDMGLILRTQ